MTLCLYLIILIKYNFFKKRRRKIILPVTILYCTRITVVKFVLNNSGTVCILSNSKTLLKTKNLRKTDRAELNINEIQSIKKPRNV